MEQILAIFTIIIIPVLSYIIGNKAIGSRSDDLEDKLINSVMGLLILVAAGLAFLMLYSFYNMLVDLFQTIL